MKKIYQYLLFFVIIISGQSFAQIPVMNPIIGSGSVCSSPGLPSGFSASASNSPTSYNWIVSPGTGVVIGTPNLANTTISFPHSNGVYTVYCTATNISGTSSAVQYTVAVFETPTVTFSGANSFCQGSSTNLQASSTILAASTTISYNWSPGTGLSSTTGTFVNASPAVTTTYSVTGTIGFCSNTSTILVTVNPLPNINVVSNASVLCIGNSATLSISGTGTTYSLNSILTPTSVVISQTATTVYTISATSSFGCYNSQNFTQYVTSCVGIKENSNKQGSLLIYPNPSNGQFTISSNVYEKGMIINKMGQVLKILYLQPDMDLKIEGLNSGIYFIKTEKSITKLVIIN